RIEVVQWYRHAPLHNIYIQRPKSARFVLGHLRKVGLREVSRKIRSRLAERERNERWFCSGWGRIWEPGPSSAFERNLEVVFLAPIHPSGMERVVLSDELVKPASDFLFDRNSAPKNRALFDAGLLSGYEQVAGWHPMSGNTLRSKDVEDLLARA